MGVVRRKGRAGCLDASGRAMAPATMDRRRGWWRRSSIRAPLPAVAEVQYPPIGNQGRSARGWVAAQIDQPWAGFDPSP